MNSPSTTTSMIETSTPHHSVKQYRGFLANDAVQKITRGVSLLECDKEDQVSVRHIQNFAPSLDLYLFKPNSETSSPKPIYIYLPASFVGMNPDIFSIICKKICALSQTTIATFRYPLAPEASISTQINAVTQAYKKLFGDQNKLHLNINNQKIVLGGYSSGSYLALHLTKKLLGQNSLLPSKLLLSFPVLDVNGEIAGNNKDPIVEKSLIDWLFAQLFINEQQRAESFSLLKQDFTNFPPMTIITSNNDYLANHALHLKRQNPKTELHNLGNISHTDFWYDPKGLMLTKLATILTAFR